MTRLTGPVGCKTQSSCCWLYAVPQDKGVSLSNSQRGSIFLHRPLFPLLPNGAMNPHHFLLH